MILKTGSFLFALLLAGTAWAYPSVGDRVQWTGSVTQANGTAVPVKITKEVMSFNKDTSRWVVKFEATMGAETTSKTVEEEHLFTRDQFKKILAQCEAQGGKLEKIAAPAGIYETCKTVTTAADGTLVEKWWGDIPFGVVSKSTRAPILKGKMAKTDLNSVIAGL